MAVSWKNPFWLEPGYFETLTTQYIADLELPENAEMKRWWDAYVAEYEVVFAAPKET